MSSLQVTQLFLNLCLSRLNGVTVATKSFELLCRKRSYPFPLLTHMVKGPFYATEWGAARGGKGAELPCFHSQIRNYLFKLPPRFSQVISTVTQPSPHWVSLNQDQSIIHRLLLPLTFLYQDFKHCTVSALFASLCYSRLSINKDSRVRVQF